MRSYKIGVLEGDGIGPEIVKATVSLLEAVARKSEGIGFDWHKFPMGWEAIKAAGNPLPEDTLRGLARCSGWIMGPHDSVSYPDHLKSVLNPSGQLRIHYDLYANIRPAKNYPSLRSLVHDTDLVIVRENTEGFYSDRNMYQGAGEFMPTADVALSTGVFTKYASERIAKVAFGLAQSRRKHVSIVHKANVIKLGNGLFLDTCKEVGTSYPDIQVDDYHIDAMAAHLVRRPHDFDVILTTNMFGDILSDLSAELVGSLGLGGSLNAGDKYAMAQAVHGAAPDIADQGVANPVGLMNSAVMLLDWIGKKYNDEELIDCAQTIDAAIIEVLSSGPLTHDLGGEADTHTFTEAVVGCM